MVSSAAGASVQILIFSFLQQIFNEEITAEKCRETRVFVALRRVIALHIVLVDAVVLQVDENAVDEADPERTACQAAAEGT